MPKTFISLLIMIFCGNCLAYAAGPPAGYGGARGGGYSGTGTGYRGYGTSGTGSGSSNHGGGYQGSGSGYHGSTSYRGGYAGGYNGGNPGGYHGGSGYHGNNHHNGHGNSYSFWVGGVAPGWWGPAYPYPRYYPYSYPYYPNPYYVPAPVVIAEQPALSDPGPEQNSYWYYCENPRGYYPYIKSCPGGWMKVVPESVPPDSDRSRP
jgi:hypothetical protein